MHGATFGILLVIVVLLAASVFMTPLALIPAGLLLVFFLLSGPLGAMVGRGSPEAGSAGATPSTGEASYDPVSEPGQRGA